MFKIVVALVFSIPGLAMAAPTDNCAKFHSAVRTGNEVQKLHRLAETQWKYVMNEYPEWATFVGYPGLDDKWADQSLAATQRRQGETKCFHAALKKIKRDALKGEDRVSYDLLVYRTEGALEADQFDSDYMPINHMDGFQTESMQVLLAMNKSSTADYEKMILRLERFPSVPRDIAELMREGLKRKAMPVKAFMPKITEQLAALTPANVEDSPYYQAFKEIGAAVPATEHAALQARAKEVIRSKVYPALAQFKEFFDKEYAPNGRESIAWTDLPNGKAWYVQKVKHYTTTAKTPDELHELGLSEVEKITAEMEQAKQTAKFKGDLMKFNQFLLKDKQFHYTSAEALLSGYRDIAKRIDPELPKLFRTLPRLPFGVRAIQDYQAKSAAGAQYISGSPESGRAGFFEANTYDLPSRPKWDMETLTMHEAAPGHHFQIAIAQELKDMPEFRKHGHFTAYVEGWALYAETLGKEMGFYKDPYAYYGHLSGQMMRAVRLVVDTGMHAKGWSKDKALAYYRSKFPTSDVDSENEINRYISWPGQALAYKVGQLKFRELRNKASVALAEKFDVRDFHDEVLRHGALPMDVLEKTVDEWTARVKKSTPVRGLSTISSR